MSMFGRSEQRRDGAFRADNQFLTLLLRTIRTTVLFPVEFVKRGLKFQIH